MLTGSQIRQARDLLGIDAGALARWTKVFKATILRAEAVDGEPPIAAADVASIRRALERAGAEFAVDPPRARLRVSCPATKRET